MNRRNFLRTGGALSLPLIANNPLSANLARTLKALVNPDSDRVLVLVQLNGGNDGLSTLVPLDQYDNLMAVRPNLMIPEDRLLKVDSKLAFHPAASGMHQLYQEGNMMAVQGVSYPDQNRSHFRSTDIWTSASNATEVVTTGWLGRNYQENHPEFPTDYPNNDNPHPFAIALGNQVTQTCQGVGTNFSMAINNPFNLLAIAGGDDTPLPDDPYGDELGFMRTSIVQANAYGQVVQEFAEQGESMVDYPDTRFAEQLKNVAYMISGGLQTSVYVVSLGGFDTHAGQVTDNPMLGQYTQLMLTLGDALAAFHADLKAQNLEKRVLSMTFSEFGRRIRSNESLGSDHGSAAPLFLMGSCVKGGTLGENPEISRDASVNEGVALQYDFRDIYGTVFEDWFELEPAQVKSVLGHDYVHLPILESCADTTSTNEEAIQDLQVQLWPNPTANVARIRFEVEGGATALSVSDATGRHLQTVFERTLPAGEHQFDLDLSAYPAGAYLVRLQAGVTVASRRLVKL
ncbi:MAG: DUF1501 domain-containing protein [Bacteroidota bacterium]